MPATDTRFTNRGKYVADPNRAQERIKGSNLKIRQNSITV